MSCFEVKLASIRIVTVGGVNIELKNLVELQWLMADCGSAGIELVQPRGCCESNIVYDLR